MKQLFTLLVLILSPSALALASGKVHEYKLKNGLKLFVKEDHRSPVVVSQVWYKVGSSYELNGTTGVSHMLEHMMFKGTKKLKPGEFSRIIAENGGKENAFTGRDYTAYFQRMEKSRLKVSFELEADRMRNLQIIDKEFQKERQVVIEERRLRTDDKPTSLTYEHFRAAAFQSNPYRAPVIGWMNDIEKMNAKDLEDWYQRWYAPNNAVVVVVGDVNPAKVYALAKKYFGPLKPSKNISPPKPQVEPKQLGIKRIVVRTPAQLPFLIMGYKTPALGAVEKDWEPYALELMAYVLDGGKSARMTKNLIREKAVASSIDVSYDLHSRLSGLFSFFALPSQANTVKNLEEAIREEIDKIKKQPVSKAELDRVKAQIVASKVYEKDSVFYQAMEIGTLETVGRSWKDSEEYLKRIKKVTPEQIQEVAQKYFRDNQLTVATLNPLPMSMKKPRKRKAIPGGRHAN